MATENGGKGGMARHLPMALAVAALLIAVYAAVVVPAGSAATISGSGQAKDATFDRMVETGTITACYVPWPPSVIKDPNTGKVSGFLIDTFEKIMGDASIKVDYVESTWGGFPADLKSGRCDVVAAGTYPLISRSTSVSFTEPYLYSGYSVVARAGDSRFKSAEDFNKPGVKIAVIQGEYGHIYAQKYFPNAELLVLEKSADLTAPLVAVSSGQADVGFSESDVIGEYVKKHPEIVNLYPDTPFATVPTTFSARKDDQQMLNFLNNGLAYLQSTGYIRGAAKKYNATYWYEAKTQYVDVGKE